eukprot:SAG11_NODE_5099_length_1665_cov_0.844189_1_plen_68_part_10
MGARARLDGQCMHAVSGAGICLVPKWKARNAKELERTVANLTDEFEALENPDVCQPPPHPPPPPPPPP